tara:strand:- start:12711 stop:13997 length:1287 start_codon:yes stop_codon:yes gene_type:complete
MNSKLKFQFIANACGIFIGKEGSKVLCDPWIEDGVFEGSWCHYPRLATNFYDFEKIDAIYVSHLHPDHFDERYFNFSKNIKIIALDHGPNYLIKKLESLGFDNILRVKDSETIQFKEFKISLFAPFAKHNFHDSIIGNLIDSAMLIECDGIRAFNTNDNTPTIETCKKIKQKFGHINLAMFNYNAAGPYPSCFNNLTEDEKISEHHRIITRNYENVRDLTQSLEPSFVLPFAGSYVLGGKQYFKNTYLGTSTWDECKSYLDKENIGETKVIVLNEKQVLDIEKGKADGTYKRIDKKHMSEYIENELSNIVYPHEKDEYPEKDHLLNMIEKASEEMLIRMQRFNIQSSFEVVLKVFDVYARIYPCFETYSKFDYRENMLLCDLDERLLLRIIKRNAHWNNAEIGAHIDFVRRPNTYEPDLHTGLQFFHL